jgi:hypothetical protein
MFKLLFVAAIVFVTYCAGVGFLRTAAELGWNESGAVQPHANPVSKIANR